MNQSPTSTHSCATQRLRDKVAIVTGASSGIGEAAARELAAQGASVVLAARRGRELDRVAREIAEAGGNATVIPADVTRDDDMMAVVETAESRLGGLDIAFNNAGALGAAGPLAEVKPDDWTATITTTLTSVFLSMRHEIPAMVRRGGGVIINNASQLALVGLGAGVSPYVAAKHGVVGLTKAAALEYAAHNIRVNALALATVDTPMFRAAVGSDEQARSAFVNMHPLGRIADVTEAASAVAYLAGDDASFFTGSVMVMDGGWTAR